MRPGLVDLSVGPSAYAIRCGAMGMFRTNGMKQWYRQFSKIGDPASCENYRPISFLAIGYKLFATILLRRLKDAGADARIWPTQFGFRAGRGCADALFVGRRLLEQTYAAKVDHWHFWL